MSPAPAELPKPTQEKTFEPSNVTKAKQQIIDAIQQFDTVVINAGTGSGKSLFGPLHILEGMEQKRPGQHLRMLIGEPRRFLAVGNAEKVAKIQKVQIGGDLVGYHHGEADKKTDRTKLTYTVNGSIRNMLQKDITLKGYDAVFLDEIHLREIDQYAIRMGLQQAQKEREKKGMPPLKVIIASADATARDGEYHGKSKYLEIPGTKPRNVEPHFAEKAVSLMQSPKEAAKLAAKLVKDKTHYGDVLAFLPGRAEILEAKAEFDRIMKEEGLADTYKSGLLTGGGGKENEGIQEMLTSGNDTNARHPLVVFGTDVAETGANFPWLTKVIDAGFSRIPVYDEKTGLTRLHTVNSAFANYKQRLGRLGRDNFDGEFHALYPEADLLNTAIHPAEQPASIMKSDLTPLLLSLQSMGLTDVYGLDYPDRPSDTMLDRAVKTLSLLGALNPDGSLSADGEVIASLPMEARFAKMFVEAKKHGCVDAMGVLYGFLNSSKSVYTKLQSSRESLSSQYPAELIDAESDYISLLHVWNRYVGEGKKSGDVQKWAQENGFDYDVLKEVERAKIDLTDTATLTKMGVLEESKVIDITSQKKGIMDSVLSGFADKLLEKNQFGFFKFTDGNKSGIQIASATGIPPKTNYFITGDIRGGKTPKDPMWAGMNQVVTEERYKEITAKVAKIHEELAEKAKKRGKTPVDLEQVEAVKSEHVHGHEKGEKTGEEKHKNENTPHHPERKEAEILADIHKENNAHETKGSSYQETAHSNGHDDGGHGTASHEESLWVSFKEALKESGRTLTYPIRQVWRWFKKLLGKDSSGMPQPTSDGRPPASSGGHH